MRTLRFLHTADWHLGAGFGSLPEDVASRRCEQQRQCITRLVERAVASDRPVDIFLVAGDVFDTPDPAPSAIGFFEAQLKKLADAQVQVFISAGTAGHDAYRPGGLWDRVELSGAQLFRERVFTSAPVRRFPDVTVWGVACDPAKPGQNLLATAADLPAYAPSIGLYHGGFSGIYKHEGERGNAFEQDDVKRAPFTYLALGHYHRRAAVLDTPTKKAFYPGAPTAISFRDSELGERYALEGELSENGEVTVSEIEIPRQFGVHRKEVLDCTRLSLEEIQEQFRHWAGRNIYMMLSLGGVVTPEIMGKAGELEEHHQDNYGYLEARPEFEDLSGAEENRYLQLFRERVRQEITQETDEESRAVLREALSLGAEALLRGGGR